VTPPTPPPSTTPVNVSASAVSKLSGSPPNIAKGRYDDELPAVIVSKVCIDTSGHVVNAAVVTKMDSHRDAQEIVDALKTWQYAPYRRNNTPTPACFFVSMRTRS
jgi:hypothetical protein